MKFQTNNTSSYFVKRTSLNLNLAHMHFHLHLSILVVSNFLFSLYVFVSWHFVLRLFNALSIKYLE